jgi:hypothetical protein
VLSPNDTQVRFMAIATFEALHQRQESRKLLNTFSYSELTDLKRWPDLAELSRDPRFLELLAAHQTK